MKSFFIIITIISDVISTGLTFLKFKPCLVINESLYSFQFVYCEPTKQCLEGSIVKRTLNKKCEGQEWKTDQCIGKLFFKNKYKVFKHNLPSVGDTCWRSLTDKAKA